MKRGLFRFFSLILPAMIVASAGLFSCSPFVDPVRINTPLSPLDDPQPVSFGDGEMQFVRLSRFDNTTPDYAQVLVDEEGVVNLFWMEELSDSVIDRSRDYRFRRRFPDGTWDIEERIENEILDFHPIFLWGENQKPCYTFYKERESPIIWLSCKTSAGWEETLYKGYAELIISRLSLFLDPPNIVTAYTMYESQTTKLFFGETQLFGAPVDINAIDLEKDEDGVYYLAYTSEYPENHANRMVVMESQDKGETWSEPFELSTNDWSPPKFLLAQDGTLYLAWMDWDMLRLAYHSPSAGWTSLMIPLGDQEESWTGDVFLGESEGGNLHIVIWENHKLYSLHGTVQNGFTVPVMLADTDDSGYVITDLSFAAGKDGLLYITWMAFKTADVGSQNVYFGWV